MHCMKEERESQNYASCIKKEEHESQTSKPVGRWKKEKISTHPAAVTDEKNEEKPTQNEAVNKKFRKFAQVDSYLRPSRRQHDYTINK